ncbi:MAG: TolC family protein [Fibrobacteres bacterium]|nr:TolC family protein [Fibrobacterota bacterium]
MRFKQIILFFIVINSYSSQYSLDDLLKATFENSKAIKAVLEERKKVESQISQAYGSALPSIDLTTTYQHSFEQYSPLSSGASMPSFASILQAAHVPQSDTGTYVLGGILDQAFGSFANMTKDNTAVVSLTLKQPIFAQGKVGIGLAIAKEYKAGLEKKLKMVQDTTRATITKSFYAALLTKKNVDILQSSVQLNEEIYRLSILRFNVGKTSEMDTLSARMNLYKAQIDLKSAETGKKVQYLALIKQSGITENYETFDLSGDFPVSDYKITYEEALPKLRENNKILQQLETGLKIQSQLVKLAKSDHYPMIAAQASVGKLSMFNSDEEIVWYDDQKIAVVMTLNLFSGFGITQKIKQARIDKTNFEYTMKQVQDGLEIGLRGACENLAVNREKIESVNALLKIAEKGLEIQKKMYDLGAATLTDLQKTEIDLKNAKIAYNASLFGYYSSMIDIKILLGE